MWHLTLALWLLDVCAGMTLQAKEEKPLSLAMQYQQKWTGYELHIRIRSQLQRQQLQEKIHLDTTIQMDATGKWYLLKIDPIRDERWEVYSLATDHEKFIMRKNDRQFRFANDPEEVRRWLETALMDFHQLVQQELQDAKGRDVARKKLLPASLKNTEVVCKEWQSQNRQVVLCFVDDLLVDGSLQVKSVQTSTPHPLSETLEATLTLAQVGSEVKPVNAPSPLP